MSSIKIRHRPLPSAFLLRRFAPLLHPPMRWGCSALRHPFLPQNMQKPLRKNVPAFL